MSKTRKKSVKMDARHYKTLTFRYLRQILSKPASFMTLILQVPVLLVILYLTYFKNSFTDPIQLPFGNTTLFVIIFIGSLMGLLNSYREITKEREITDRELAGGLDPAAYVMSKITVQGIIAVVQGALLILGTLIFIDYNFSSPVLNTLSLIVTEVAVIWVSSTLGLFVSAIVKSSEAAVLPVLLIIICQVVFTGTLFELNAPANYIGYLCPCTWGVAIFGKLIHFNTILPGFTRAVYDYSYIQSMLALAIMMIVLSAATVSVITGRKLKKNRLK